MDVNPAYRVLLLLNLDLGTILELPLHDVRLIAGTLDVAGVGKGGPELGEVLELDEVPDMGEWSCETIRGLSWQLWSFLQRANNNSTVFSLSGSIGGAQRGIAPLMTADSTTEVLVGIAEDMVALDWMEWIFPELELLLVI